MVVKLSSINDSIIGEGALYGIPCVEIVLAGEDAFGENITGHEEDYSAVKSKIDELLGDFKQNKFIYVTGGEPLNQIDFLEQLQGDYSAPVCIKTSTNVPENVCFPHILLQVRRENNFGASCSDFNELIILVDDAMTYEEFMNLPIFNFIGDRIVWLMPKEMNQKLWEKCHSFISRKTGNFRLGIQLKCEKGISIGGKNGKV